MVYGWNPRAEAVLSLARQGCELHFYETRRTFRDRTLGKFGVPPRDQFNWLDRKRPDLAIISSVGHPASQTEINACRKRGIPYLLILQAANEGQWTNGPDSDSLYECYRGAEVVCFVSRKNQLLVETQFGRPLPNARVVRNPFNVLPDASPTWPADQTTFRLACLGRLDPWHKGQDLIIEVLGRQKWRERPISVSFVGRGPSEPNLRRLAEWRQAAIQFQGFTNDIESVWAAHHGLILPSRAEGLPLALVEAMMCHRMAVVTDVGGNAEVVEEGRSGFIAPAPMADLVDAALERAWDRRNEWKEMGLEAGRRIRELVPPDPAAVFADLIEETARSVAARTERA